MSERQFIKALARERGISEDTAKSSFYKWKSEKHTPNRENAEAIAKILKGDPADFTSERPVSVDLLEEFRRRLDRAEAEIAALRSERSAPGRKRASTGGAA